MKKIFYFLLTVLMAFSFLTCKDEHINFDAGQVESLRDSVVWPCKVNTSIRKSENEKLDLILYNTYEENPAP